MGELIRTSFETKLGSAVALFDESSLVYFTIHGPGVKYDIPRILKAAPKGFQISDSTHPLSERLEAELEAYFRGDLREFSIPYTLYGTSHQKTVWQLLAGIPYGETVTYKVLAERAGIASFRAVGTMVGLNPIPILLPCHRIVRADKRIGCFSCAQGTDTKRFLLELEGAEGFILNPA